MADRPSQDFEITPTEAMADVVRGPGLNGRIERSRPIPSVAPPTSPTLAQVLQAYDEILKRLESAKMQADEVRSLTTRATLPNQPKQASISDLEGGTIFDQLAARAVMISRVAEEIEHNLALSLSAMR